jgi:intein-encoded DNA endonuclease-like protein
LSRKEITVKANYLGLKVRKELIGTYFLNKEDMSYFINIKEPFAAYFLGFLWADGCIAKETYNIKLKIVNEDFVDIQEQILSTGKTWRLRLENDGNPKHKEQAILEINNKTFWEFLVNNDYLIKSGASACKILDKIPESLHFYWWRGFFDGDGGFTIKSFTKRISLTSVNYQDWTFLYNLCKKLETGWRLGIKNKGKSKVRQYFLKMKLGLENLAHIFIKIIFLVLKESITNMFNILNTKRISDLIKHQNIVVFLIQEHE